MSVLSFPKSKDFNEQESATNTPLKTDSVLLVINYGEDNISTYSVDFESGKTVLSLLKDITEKENITLETKQYDFGIFVESINGKKSTNETAWIYFVNGESGQIAADQQQVNSGDIVEWKYIKPSASEQ